MRKTCLEMVYQLARRDPRIVFIGSDLGAGTLREFQDEMPERFFMEGVCEANVIGMAAGLALEGKIVYVNTIASFLTRRCFEQIVIDLCLHSANVRLIGNGGGMVYAPLGPTHQVLEDFATLRAVPNMTILAPADANEMRRLMPQTVEHGGPVYIRLAKGYDPIVTPDDAPFEIGKAYPMHHGQDALILTTGMMLKTALDAARFLKTGGIGVSVLHLPTLKPLDTALVLDFIDKSPIIVTIEEHSLIGGLGSIVAELIAEANFVRAKRFKRLGIPDVFPDQYGSQAGLLERYDLTVDCLVATIRNLFKMDRSE